MALVERWDGTQWQRQAAPAPQSSDLFGVSCVSARDCVAVGERSNFAAVLIERWDGARWSVENAPSAAGSALYGVACVSPRECFAVGRRNPSQNGAPSGALVERWDGSQWRIQGAPSSSDNSLLAISCVSTRDCVAVGARTIFRGAPSGALVERWNGTRWSRQQAPGPNGFMLFGVSCASALNCVVVGGPNNGGGSLIDGWDGAQWSGQQTPSGTGGPLSSVSCVTVQDCVAVGSGASGSLVEEWGGTQWSVRSAPGATASLHGVSCIPAGGCIAVGETGTGALLVERNGTSPRAARVASLKQQLVVGAVAAAAVVSVPIAQSAMQPTWQPPQLLPLAIGELTSLSCPSTGLCLGAGVPSSTGTNLPSFVISTHPSSAAAWHFDGHSDGGDWQVFECSSTALCVGSYSRGLRTDLYASTHPDRGRYSFTKVAANINAASISCATARFCAVVSGSAGENARVWVSVDPARPGSWHLRATLPHELTLTRGDQIMCPSSEVCIVFATQGPTNDVAILEDPASSQSGWVRADADPEADGMAVIGGSCHHNACDGEQFTGGSCVAPGSCILTTGYGAIVASTSVANGSPTWTRTVIYGDGHEQRGAYGLSDPVCFSSSLCYILGSRGDLLVSTAPFSSNPTTWSTIRIAGTTPGASLSCPTPQTCLVVDPARTGNRTALVVGHLAPEQLAGITVSSGGDIGSRTHTPRIIASGSLVEELDGTRWSARRASAGAASTTAVVSSSGVSSLPHTILEDIHSVLHPFAQDSLTGRPGKADSTCHLRGMPGLRVPPYPACKHVEATLTSAFLVASGGGFHTDCNDPYAVTYHFYEVHTYGQGFNTCGPGPQGILRSPIRTTPGQLLPALVVRL